MSNHLYQTRDFYHFIFLTRLAQTSATGTVHTWVARKHCVVPSLHMGRVSVLSLLSCVTACWLSSLI